MREMAVACFQLEADGSGTVSTVGLALVLASALAWSIGNVLIKKSKVQEIFAFVVWASLFPPIPLLLLTWLAHGSAPLLGVEPAAARIPGITGSTAVAADPAVRHRQLDVNTGAMAKCIGVGGDAADLAGARRRSTPWKGCAGRSATWRGQAGKPAEIKSRQRKRAPQSRCPSLTWWVV